VIGADRVQPATAAPGLFEAKCGLTKLCAGRENDPLFLQRFGKAIDKI
jgi:hypothetical protein